MSIRRVSTGEAAAVRADDAAMNKTVSRGDWMTRGDTGDDVKALQRGLKAAGLFSGPVDGKFGVALKTSVQTFQRQKGLVVDGEVGPQTLGALRENNLFVADHFAQPAKVGQAGKDILGIEKKMHAMGIDTGKVDGVFDQKTLKAVRGLRAKDPELGDKRQDITGRFERELDKRAAFREANGITAPVKLPEVRDTVADTLKRFDTTAPAGGVSPIAFRGVRVNERTKTLIERAEFIMENKLGHKDFQFSISQGSFSSSVGASAGTHDGGGALDIRTSGLPKKTVDDMVKAMRQAGFAAWSRGRGFDSFTPHIHAIAIGDASSSSGAKNQVAEYGRGGDGLVGSQLDPDRGLGRPVPTWAQRFT